jgi:hypothetical protein
MPASPARPTGTSAEFSRSSHHGGT